MNDEARIFSDPVTLLQRLVRVNTVNPPGNESQLCDILEEPLRRIGFAVERSRLFPGRESLIAYPAQLPGSLICFTGHLDTVPLGATDWVHDPCSGVIEQGCIFGRGATDMKGGIAAFLVAAARHYERFGTAPRSLILLTAGEETGCEGAKSLSHLKERSFPVTAIVIGEPTLNELVVGHKGALWLRAETDGVSAHGSMPELGENAIYHAADAIARLRTYRVQPTENSLLGRSSLNVGTIRGGSSVNLVPDAAQLEIDIRTVGANQQVSLLDDIQSYLGEKVRLTTMIDVPSLQTDPHHAWVREVAATIASVTGKSIATSTVSFFTDGPALREIFGEVPTVIVGPGDPGCAHTTNESCSIARLIEATEIYSRIIG